MAQQQNQSTQLHAQAQVHAAQAQVQHNPASLQQAALLAAEAVMSEHQLRQQANIPMFSYD